MHASLKAARTLSAAVLLAGTVAGTSAAQERQDDDSFRWSSPIQAGHLVHVKNLNGSIEVEATGGSTVEVHAVKSWRRGDPRNVRIEATTLPNGTVAICALWNEQSRCDGGNSTIVNNRDDTQVDFRVRVPRGVRIAAHTVNGKVTIAGATLDVSASTVNGDIRAETNGGVARASSVNGDLRLRMAALPENERLAYSTVNGDVLLELPAALNADVSMSTLNGRFRTDFPMAVEGRMNRRRIRGTIGSGGARLDFSTLNGDVEIRRHR